LPQSAPNRIRELRFRRDQDHEGRSLPKRHEGKRVSVNPLRSREANRSENQTPRARAAATLSPRERANAAVQQSSDARRARGLLRARCRFVFRGGVSAAPSFPARSSLVETRCAEETG